jgi:hypothetical protein
MDDFTLASLQESKNEWCARLVNILTPLLIEGFGSIYNEAFTLCEKNEERSKYLMTFQNFIARVPKWNATIIKDESTRIIERSGCNYLEDLISCVHIIQLKALTACRVGIKQRKINVQIPNISSFIHKVYINAARKMYLNIYLFEKDIPPLQIQKNNRELEIIIKEIILNTVRENIPVEDLLKAYLDETEETDVVVEEKRETIVDKEQMEENLKLEKEKVREKDSAKPLEKLTTEDSTEITDVASSDDKDLLLKMNKSLEDMNVNTTNLELSTDKYVSSSDQTNDSEPKTIMSAPMPENEDNSNTLRIEDEDLTNNLEIMDINTLDTEPDIKLDIEELT